MECGICWKGKHCDFIDSSPDIDVRLRSAYVFTLSEANARKFSSFQKQYFPAYSCLTNGFGKGRASAVPPTANNGPALAAEASRQFTPPVDYEMVSNQRQTQLHLMMRKRPGCRE